MVGVPSSDSSLVIYSLSQANLFININLPGGTIPPQFSVPKQYVNSEFTAAIVMPPIVQLTITNDSPVTGK